jgi:hypothetical protein
MLVAILAMTVATALLSQCFASPALGAVGAAGVFAIGVAAFGWAAPVAAFTVAVAVLLAVRATHEVWGVRHEPAANVPCDLQTVLPIDWERFMRDLAEWSAARARGGRTRRS